MPNLFKRNGTWYINYRINGKQYRKSTKTRNKKLAEIALKDLEIKLFKGVVFESKVLSKEDRSLDKLVYRYLQHVNDNTVSKYARGVKFQLNRWREFFEKEKVYMVEDISISLIDDFFALQLKESTAKTKKEYLASLKACINRAVKWGMISYNPIKDARIEKKIVRKINFFTKEQMNVILNQMSEKLQIAIIILSNTGIRLGELWALRWIDVDFKNEQIWIRSYDDFIPKGKRDRSIPLTKSCLKVLKNLYKNKSRKDNYVYRLFVSPDALSSQFKYYLKKLGLNGRLHDLRHTFASHLVMNGTPLPVVQEFLGHANITTTMVYSHLAPNIHRREIQKLKY